MITEFGHFLLLAALGLAGVGLFCSLKCRSVLPLFLKGQAWCLGGSFFALMWAFFQSDFSVGVVAAHSHGTTPWIYRVAATWGHHEGSMVLWCFLLSLYGAAFASKRGKIDPLPYERALGIFNVVSVGFLIYGVFLANPFVRLMPFPINQGELNPLLQDQSMTFHPILLYAGYLGFVVPYALAMVGETVHGKGWMGFGVSCLTLGMTTGSIWAFYELGWGGWWFWDPVENASLLPWLLSLGVFHAYRRGHLLWAERLTMGCFLLCLMGVWVVRGGMLTSVHSFALDPDRSLYLLGLLGFFLILSLGGAMGFLRPPLRQASPSQTLFQKGLDLALYFFCYLTLVVFLSLLVPLCFKVFFNQSMTFEMPYFKRFFCLPLLGGFFVMALAPLLPRLSWKVGGGAAALSLVGGWILGRGFLPGLFGFVGVWGIFHSVLKAVRSFKDIGKYPLIMGHLGASLLLLGASVNGFKATEVLVPLKVGDSLEVGSFKVHFDGVQALPASNHMAYEGHFSLEGGPGVLRPQRRLYFATKGEHSEAALHRKGLSLLTLMLGETHDQTTWIVRAYFNPMVLLIWIGGLFMALGFLVLCLQRGRRM